MSQSYKQVIIAENDYVRGLFNLDKNSANKQYINVSKTITLINILMLSFL